jgi:dTDP-4-dehydrorhamnose reductase
MRILINSGNGMMGHQLLRRLRTWHEVHTTLRNPPETYASYGQFGANCFGGIDVRNFEQVRAYARSSRPQVIVNAVGL